MSKKKSTKGKKNVSKTPKNNIDINDIDAMLEDMKNLALDKTEEKKETESIVAAHEETKDEEIVENLNDGNLVNEEESFTNIFPNAIETGPNVPIIINSLEDRDKVYNEDINKELEKEEDITETENVEKEEEIEDTEDLSFVDEVKESEDNEEEKEIQEEKPVQKKQRRTYQEMFGGSWRGYGYDEF